MNRFLTYLGILAVSVVMQLMVFDPMQLGAYVRPLVYIAFIVLLPMNTMQVVMLACGLALGVLMDVFEGTGGLATMTLMPVALARRWALIWIVGRESVEADLMPSIKTIGVDKFLRYVALMVFGYSVFYFALDGLTWRYLHLVAVRTAMSGAITMVAVWAVSLLFTIKVQAKQ